MNSNSLNQKLINTIDRILGKEIIIFILFVIFIIYHLIRIPLQIAGVDSGYYLSISRDLYLDGLLPITGIRTIYTPIGYYFFGIPFLIFSKSSITTFYYFNLIITILSTLLFSNVLKNYDFKYRRWSLLIFFVTISPLIYDIKLELIVVLFLVIAYIFHSKYLLNNILLFIFISGIFVGLSVLTKQYALLLWPMTIVFQFSFSKEDKKFLVTKKFINETIIFSAGVILILTVFFIFHLVIQKDDSKYIMDQFWGKVYYDCLGLYGARLTSNIIAGIKYYTKFAPYIFFIPLLLLVKPNRNDWIRHLALLTLFFASLAPYFFQIYPHYFYFGFIPVFLLSIKIFQNSRFGHYIIPLFLFPLIVNIYSLYALNRDFTKLKLAKQVETEFYDQIRKYVPEGSQGFVEGKKQIYFECGLRSVHPKNVGYDYVPSLCIDYLLADTMSSVDQFYYVGPNKDLNFEGCSRTYIGETGTLEGFTPHFVYSFVRPE